LSLICNERAEVYVGIRNSAAENKDETSFLTVVLQYQGGWHAINQNVGLNPIICAYGTDSSKPETATSIPCFYPFDSWNGCVVHVVACMNHHINELTAKT
jgi:hypothetical protein